MFDHIGLRVKDLEKAKQLHTAMRAPRGQVLGPAGEGYAGFGPKAGAKDNGKPGLRTGYAPNYYGTFLLAGEGNNVEAVCYR